MNEKLHLSSGPHVRDRWTTRHIMLLVLGSLAPTAVIGVLVHGVHALLIILTSILAAVAGEWLFCLITKRPNSIVDGSALVTGMLLALSLSPSVPLYVPAVGAVFAVVVVKCCFGGLGKNFVNPALAARCFLLISFGGVMTQFPGPDAVSQATPLMELAAGRAVDVTRIFLGTTNGVIGNSAAGLLLGGLFLWGMDVIHGEICFSVLAGFTLFMGLFGGQGFDPRFLLAHLCGGGVIMGAFYMATDYTTSPVSRLGQLTYGCLIGVLGGVFRVFSHSTDSFSYSVILANLFTPLIDMYVIPKPYAYRKAMQRRLAGEKPVPIWQRIPKPVAALTLITLLAGLALGGAYSLTKDTIADQKAAANKAAYQAVCPDAVSFTLLSDLTDPLRGQVYGTDFGRTYINEAAMGRDAAGNVVGYAISATSMEAYDGDLTLYVGIGADGTVRSISYTEIHETPGKGMLCAEPAFQDQFHDRSVTSFKLNGGGADGIDAVSGATVTSKAVVRAVNAALDFYRSVIRGE